MRVDGCAKAKQSCVLILGSMESESVITKGQHTSLIREEIRPADSSKEPETSKPRDVSEM